MVLGGWQFLMSKVSHLLSNVGWSVASFHQTPETVYFGSGIFMQGYLAHVKQPPLRTLR